MAIVKFESLGVNAKVRVPDYMDALLVPMVANSGPQTSMVYSPEEFYSLFNPVKSEDGKFIERLLDLGYRVLVYRVNYVDEYSTIKIMDTDTYSYFSTKKSYQEGFGPVTTNKYLGDNSLSWSLNLNVFDPFTIEELFHDSDYRVLIFSKLNTVIRFHKGKKDPRVDSNLAYRYHYDLEYIEQYPDRTDTRPGIKHLTIADIRDILSEIIINNLGGNPEVTEDGNLEVTFNSLMDPYSDIIGFLSSSKELSYDYVYSDGLTKPGIRFKSKVEDSDSDIQIAISKESNTEYIFGLERIKDGKSLYSESIYTNLDPNSEYYLYRRINTSKLIEYLDGEITPDMVGTYTLGYPTPKKYDIYESGFDSNLETDYPILFVVSSQTWNENSDKIKVQGYSLSLANLARNLESVALIPDPYSSAPIGTSNLMIVTPNIKSSYQTSPVELLLQAVQSNQMEGDLEFSGRLDGTPSVDGINVVTIERDQYRFTFNHGKVVFQGKTIPLKIYCGWVAVDRFIKDYLDRNAIAKFVEVDLDDLRSQILNKYENLISEVEFESTRVNRKYGLTVYLTFETQTPQKLILIVNLIEE